MAIIGFGMSQELQSMAMMCGVVGMYSLVPLIFHQQFMN